MKCVMPDRDISHPCLHSPTLTIICASHGQVEAYMTWALGSATGLDGLLWLLPTRIMQPLWECVQM